jgi:hypothetical protein
LSDDGHDVAQSRHDFVNFCNMQPVYRNLNGVVIDESANDVTFDELTVYVIRVLTYLRENLPRAGLVELLDVPICSSESYSDVARFSVPRVVVPTFSTIH